MLVTPLMTKDDVRMAVKEQGFVGLKCYHVWSLTEPTFESEIGAYLPDHLCEVASELHLSITLHLVRARALCDTGNQRTIRRLCEQFPGMRLILAHAARGFNMHHTIDGLESLRGLTNVWFDTAAVCEAGAIEAIIAEFGHGKLLYGSDFPITHIRGKCVTIADSFFW